MAHGVSMRAAFGFARTAPPHKAAATSRKRAHERPLRTLAKFARQHGRRRRTATYPAYDPARKAQPQPMAQPLRRAQGGWAWITVRSRRHPTDCAALGTRTAMAYGCESKRVQCRNVGGGLRAEQPCRMCTGLAARLWPCRLGWHERRARDRTQHARRNESRPAVALALKEQRDEKYDAASNLVFRV